MYMCMYWRKVGSQMPLSLTRALESAVDYSAFMWLR